ncbi:hypothetical protein ACE6H2_016291 [Prunus campanulata]
MDGFNGIWTLMFTDGHETCEVLEKSMEQSRRICLRFSIGISRCQRRRFFQGQRAAASSSSLQPPLKKFFFEERDTPSFVLSLGVGQTVVYGGAELWRGGAGGWIRRRGRGDGEGELGGEGGRREREGRREEGFFLFLFFVYKDFF